MNEYCETYIKISKDALIHNARFFKKDSQKKLIAVIKSNAYGHGLIEVGKILEPVSDLFAVASLDSAVNLRKVGIKIPILVLNPLASDYALVALEHDIMITVSSLAELKQFEQVIKDSESPLKVHLKIDSGMNRMGVKTISEAKDIIEYNSQKLKIVGIYTHFHSADDEGLSKKQQKLFKDIYEALDTDFEYVHMCSTSAALNKWDLDFTTHVRMGLGLYGICESSDVKPVLSMYSKIMIKKQVLLNETVGYSARFKAREDTWIGVLPCGYSDGIIRANTGRKVYIDGYYCEIVGNVCMNSLMVKLPHQNVSCEVELIGPHISAIEIAKHLKTISYEVVTILPPHIKRIVE